VGISNGPIVFDPPGVRNGCIAYTTFRTFVPAEPNGRMAQRFLALAGVVVVGGANVVCLPGVLMSTSMVASAVAPMGASMGASGGASVAMTKAGGT